MIIGLAEILATAGGITTLCVAGGWLSKTIKAMVQPLKDLQRITKIMCEAHRAVLRNAIVRVQKEADFEGGIGLFAYQSATEMYNVYKKLDGNGFVDEVYRQITDIYEKGNKS